jgi:FkbM family methyltransferase
MSGWLNSLAKVLGIRRRTWPKAGVDGFAAQRLLVSNQRPTILDVGAHRGETALRYRALFPQAVIHCFEPFAESFAALQTAVARDQGVHTHRVALGAESGRARLNVNRGKATNSLLASDDRSARYWGEHLLDTEKAVEVPVQTLSAFCASHAITRIDILKLDVQGAEYQVLTGADELLRAQAIDVVYFELITAPTYVGQRELHDYLALFRSRGYELFDFYNPVRKNGRLLQTDNVMVSGKFLGRYERECLANER